MPTTHPFNRTLSNSVSVSNSTVVIVIISVSHFALHPSHRYTRTEPNWRRRKEMHIQNYSSSLTLRFSSMPWMDVGCAFIYSFVRSFVRHFLISRIFRISRGIWKLSLSLSRIVTRNYHLDQYIQYISQWCHRSSLHRPSLPSLSPFSLSLSPGLSRL